MTPYVTLLKSGFSPSKLAISALRVVGHIAVAVGRRANEEGATVLKDAGIQSVHDLDRRLVAGRFQRLLNLLSDHLGGAGHGAHQDRDVYGHACIPTREPI